MRLDLDGRGPLFRQVYRALREAIRTERLPPGSRAPTTRSLASRLGVSRTTVLLAYEQLAAEGYVDGRQGSGTYVRAGERAPSPAAPSRRSLRPRLSPLGTRLVAERRLPLLSAYASAGPRHRWDFRYGMPSLAEFPLQAWQRCVGRCARRGSLRMYDYGPPLGALALRRALADYLGRSRGVRADPEQILVVTGSQQGLDLTARLLLAPGDRAVVEEPGFEGARNAFLAAGAKLAAVAVDAEGLDPESLRAVPGPVRVVHVTPSHQFPLGGVMSYARRATLLQWASEHGAWLVEDDYDGEFRFDGRPFPPLKSLDADGRVLYLGTFSKVMFPAIRLGYLVLPPALVDVFARAKVLADGGSARLEQEALAEFIDRGEFERHVRRARARNGERRAALLGALQSQCGDAVEVCGANAGLHVVVWLRGFGGRTTGSVVRRAAAAGVGVYSVRPHYLEPPREAGLVLGFAGLTPKEIRAGVAALARALA